MGFSKPTGKFAAQMLEPGGWPDLDEAEFLSRASLLTSKLQELVSKLESWLSEQTEVSSGGIWSGSGANAGSVAIQRSIDDMSNQQAKLARAIGWLNHIF